MADSKRYLFEQIRRDLGKKMVLLGGPRQVGKTTLAKKFLKSENGYLNWDVAAHREKILKGELPDTDLWLFDEIHKYKNWRNFLKGLFDDQRLRRKILVTGSARLDFYRRGGDSLQGRYFFLRLHPLSVKELGLRTPRDFETLLTLGGFPEPFFGGSQVDARRWSQDYRQRLIQEDLVSLEKVHDLGTLELMILRLPSLVGSPLSINALREDLQVSHRAVSNWLAILERLYALFRISPFGTNLIKAVKKEQKHYHFDWSLVEEPSCRFENLVASHLLKWIDYQRDTQGLTHELRYFRTVDDKEVDFIVTRNQKPLSAVECKWSDAEIGKGLRYFKSKFPSCEAWQLSATGTKDYVTPEGIRVCPATVFLNGLI